MDYLIVKFFWWLVLAFAVGMIVGWMTCNQNEDDQAK